MKRLLIINFLLLLLYSCSQAQAVPEFWEQIVEFKKQDVTQPPPAHPILFVGSSSFTKWKDVNDYFPGYTIINRGFGGSTLVDVMRYTYDIILPYRPKQVVIYCGENDMAYDDNLSPEEAIQRFKTFYGMLRQNLPEATIDFVSLKPSPARAKMQEKSKYVNLKVSEFLKKEKNAAFIDIYSAMLDAKGNMRRELYVEDELHMNAEGYRIWQRVFLPYLNK